jgi:AraC-like DNA-binding protein
MLNLLTHGYGQFTPRHPVGPVAWPHFDLFYVHSGRIRLRFAGAPDVALARGEGVLIYPDTPFNGSVLTAEVSASVQHFAIEPPDGPANPVLSELCGLRSGFEVFRRPHSAEVGPDVVRAMALASRPAEARTHALREAQLTVILGFLRNSARRREEPAPGGEDFHQTLSWAGGRHGAVSVSAFARRAGYSASRFREILLRNLGLSPSDYLLKLRINEAKRLLRESRVPLKEIARNLGYGDVVAFHRAFTRETRCPPGAYRKRHAPRG